MTPVLETEDTRAVCEYAQLLGGENFARVLGIEVSRARRYEHPLSLLVVGMDEWPLLVVQRGRAAATRLLDNLASDLCRWLRDVDYVAPLGDGALALLLPETDRDGACPVAAKVAGAARELVHVTVRAGQAAYPCDALTSEHLLAEASAALDLARLQHVGVAGNVALG